MQIFSKFHSARAGDRIFNRLIIRIQMTEECSPDKPIAYVYDHNKNTESRYAGFIVSDSYGIVPYNVDSLINM